VSIKIIVTVTVLTLLSIYVAFLNPQKIDFHLTQHETLHMPMVIFFLGSILTGVLSSLVIYWFTQISRSLSGMSESRTWKQKERERAEWDSLMAKGINSRLCENYEQATYSFKKIIKDNPSHSSALLQLGMTYRELGDCDLAIHIHSKLCESEPGNIAALYELAEDYAAAGQLDNQVETLRKICNKSLRSKRPLNAMKDALEKNKDWDQLCDVQNKIASQSKIGEERNEANAKLAEYTYNKAMDHFSASHHETGLEEMRRALKIDYKFAPAYVALGDAHSRTEKTDMAINAWKAGFERTGCLDCLNRWQSVLTQDDDKSEIIGAYENAIQESDPSAKNKLVQMLTDFYLKNGQLDNAIETLQTHSQESSTQEELLLASLLKEQGNNAEAEKILSSLTESARNRAPACEEAPAAESPAEGEKEQEEEPALTQAAS